MGVWPLLAGTLVRPGKDPAGPPVFGLSAYCGSGPQARRTQPLGLVSEEIEAAKDRYSIPKAMLLR